MILVVGPGRCGSSAIARVLHMQLGVNMGERFRAPDTSNPNGYYEDIELKEHNQVLLSGDISLDDWRKALRELVGKRREPWGFKDPRLCYTLGHYLELALQVDILRCRRSPHSVALSMSRAYGWDYMDALAEVARRERMLDILAPHAPSICTDEHLSDAEIIRLLGGYVHARSESNKGGAPLAHPR